MDTRDIIQAAVQRAVSESGLPVEYTETLTAKIASQLTEAGIAPDAPDGVVTATYGLGCPRLVKVLEAHRERDSALMLRCRTLDDNREVWIMPSAVAEQGKLVKILDGLGGNICQSQLTTTRASGKSPTT